MMKNVRSIRVCVCVCVCVCIDAAEMHFIYVIHEHRDEFPIINSKEKHISMMDDCSHTHTTKKKACQAKKEAVDSRLPQYSMSGSN